MSHSIDLTDIHQLSEGLATVEYQSSSCQRRQLQRTNQRINHREALPSLDLSLYRCSRRLQDWLRWSRRCIQNSYSLCALLQSTMDSQCIKRIHRLRKRRQTTATVINRAVAAACPTVWYETDQKRPNKQAAHEPILPASAQSWKSAQSRMPYLEYKTTQTAGNSLEMQHSHIHSQPHHQHGNKAE